MRYKYDVYICTHTLHKYNYSSRRPQIFNDIEIYKWDCRFSKIQITDLFDITIKKKFEKY